MKIVLMSELCSLQIIMLQIFFLVFYKSHAACSAESQEKLQVRAGNLMEAQPSSPVKILYKSEHEQLWQRFLGI